MKKWLCALLCLLVPLCCCAEITPDDLCLPLEGEYYALGEDVTLLLAKVTEMFGSAPLEQRSPSCMFEGEDVEYSNDALYIGTYPIGGKDVIESVMVIAEGIPTTRGIAVGSTMQAVIDAYGTNYTTDFDQMIYRVGAPGEAPEVVFILNQDELTVATYYIILNTQPE